MFFFVFFLVFSHSFLFFCYFGLLPRKDKEYYYLCMIILYVRSYISIFVGVTIRLLYIKVW